MYLKNQKDYSYLITGNYTFFFYYSRIFFQNLFLSERSSNNGIKIIWVAYLFSQEQQFRSNTKPFLSDEKKLKLNCWGRDFHFYFIVLKMVLEYMGLYPGKL